MKILPLKNPTWNPYPLLTADRVLKNLGVLSIRFLLKDYGYSERRGAPEPVLQ